MNIKFLEQVTEEQFLKNWGEISAVCYDTDSKRAKGVAKHCLGAKHFSGSRGQYFVFEVDGISRASVDQIIRHETGVFKNVQSQRYVSKADFGYYTPPKVQGIPEALELYNSTMKMLQTNYAGLQEILIKNGFKGEVANENARGILPMNVHSKVVIGFTIEALIHFLGKRLCVRTQDETRKFAQLLKHIMDSQFPVISPYMVVQCDSLMYCPENAKGCKHPSKNIVADILNQYEFDRETNSLIIKE